MDPSYIPRDNCQCITDPLSRPVTFSKAAQCIEQKEGTDSVHWAKRSNRDFSPIILSVAGAHTYASLQGWSHADHVSDWCAKLYTTAGSRWYTLHAATKFAWSHEIKWSHKISIVPNAIFCCFRIHHIFVVKRIQKYPAVVLLQGW